MRPPGHEIASRAVLRLALPLLALVSVVGCSFDTDRAAPEVAPPTVAGACGTTETLFPKLLAFVRADRFEPLRRVIEVRLLPTEEDPSPDPSLRTLLGTIVRLIEQLGLDRTTVVLNVIRKAEVEAKLAPLLSTVFKFMDGRIDGRPHYEAADAGALFMRRCNPDHLLTAVEGILRLESPSHGNQPWVVALVDEARPLLAEPSFQPFLDGFEREAQRGRPAIISLLVQVLIFLADDGFAIDRVETLLESAVYPVVSVDLRARIEALVVLLEEATAKQAGILPPIQQAVRCGHAHPGARDDVLGFGYDLLNTEEVGLEGVLSTTNDLIARDAARAELVLAADVVKIIREDLTIRDDARELVAILLSRPDVQLTVPVLIDLIDSGVLAELVDAVVKLLGGCGRIQSE